MHGVAPPAHAPDPLDSIWASSAFRVGVEAQKRRRRINDYAQLANVCAFFPYKDGCPARIESRPEATDQPQAA